MMREQWARGVRWSCAAACVAATALSLSGCGGGGPTVALGSLSTPSSPTSGGGTSLAQSPYLLFANDYIVYGAQTNGAYLHSIQAGDLYAGAGGNYAYGGYSSPQAAINSTGYYTFQVQAVATAPTTAADYAYVAVLAPQDATFDISQSNTLLITMGNTYYPPYNNNAAGGNVKVLTVDINNGVGSTPASNDCSYDQTVPTYSPSAPNTVPGVRNYAIPLSSFTCSTGTMAGLLANGITTVAVDIKGNKNPGVAPGEFDDLSVGSIGFTNWNASASDIAALAK